MRRYCGALCITLLCVLANCRTPSSPGSTPPVCGISAVVRFRTLRTQLQTGWKSGPIAAPTITLSLATVGGSSVNDLTDVSEVRLPAGPTIARLIATNFTTGTGIGVLAQSANGTNAWSNVSGPSRAGLVGWTRTSATTLGGEIHGCYVSQDGRAFLASPHPTAATSWSVGDIELWQTEPTTPVFVEDPNVVKIPGAGRVGPFADISCAGAEAGLTPNAQPTELHVCAVTTDARIWHTVFNGSTWTPFGDVQRQISNNGPAERVACATEGRNLHLIAVVRRSGAWFLDHTIRAPNGTWRNWVSLIDEASGNVWTAGSSDPIRDVSAAFCDAEGPMPTPRETKRLNVAWVTDQNVFIVERSRGIVDWAPGRSGSVSPSASIAAGGPSMNLESISITQMPFRP